VGKILLKIDELSEDPFFWVLIFVILLVYAVISSENEKQECRDNGVKYYKEIGSYPNLSTGKNTDNQIDEMCGNNPRAFNFDFSK